MIINTVIVFLRDLLPIFVLFSYLAIILKNKHLPFYFWIISLLAGLTASLILFTNVETVTEYFDGAGLEIILTSLLVIGFVAFLTVKSFSIDLYHKSALMKAILLLGICAFIAFKSTEFLIYFTVNIQQQDQLMNIIIGCILGFGICISFSALLSFLLQELQATRFNTVFWLCWYAFLAGHISQSTALLSQVDIVEFGAPFFDMSHIIQDSSEYGHILHALFGYESSPSFGFLFVYLACLFIPISLDIFSRRKRPLLHKTAVIHE